jgi:nucleotide-binding universal stress UspA family protein
MNAAPINADQEPPFRTVLVAADLSHAASRALLRARSIAESNKAMLIIVHCIDPVAYAFPQGAPESVLADPSAREEFERIEDETREQTFPPHTLLESETVVERLLQATHDCHADLLVLGTRAVTVIGRLALGSIAMHLLAHTPCAVLCVPQTETAPEDAALSEIAFTN